MARIAIVGIHYRPENTGIGPYTRELCQSLATAGIDVVMITGVPHYPQWRVANQYRRGLKWTEQDGPVTVHRVRHWVPRRAGLLGRAAMELTFLVGTTLLLMRNRSDAVIAVSPSLSAVAAARVARRGRRVGALVQDLVGNAASESGTTGAAIGRAIAAAELRLLRTCERVAVIDDAFSEALVMSGIDPERVDSLPNFSRFERADVDRDTARRALGWPVDRYVVLHTGNVGRKQGLELVVDAARRAISVAPDVCFVIAGDGNCRADLEASAAGVESVRFIPPVPDDDFPTLLAAADVLLVCERPGVREMSLPSKITSYVVAERPIVGSCDREGITWRYLAQRQLAHLAPAGDAAALLDAVLAVRSGAVETATMIKRAVELSTRELSRRSAAERYTKFARVLLEPI